jgi:chitinase
LDKDYGSDGVGDGDIDSPENTAGGGPKCDSRGSYDSLEKTSNDTNLDAFCAHLYALYVLQKKLETAINKFYQVDNGYDSKFDS